MGVNLSDGEWRLMDALWQKDPCTDTKLVEHFRESTGWSKHYRNLPCYCGWKPRGRYATKKGRGQAILSRGRRECG